MSGPEEKRRQDAARAKRYRQRKKLRNEMTQDEIDLAPESDTPLARARLGLQPNDDDVTERFAARNEPLVDCSQGGTGLAARGDIMDTPYSARSRKAAQEAERLADVIDYSQGAGHVPHAQRDRSRRERLLRRLTNAERRDAFVREAKLRYMEAAEDGELEDRDESIDWSTVSENGYLPEQRQEDLDPHSVRFVNPWNRTGFDRFEAESVTLDLRK